MNILARPILTSIVALFVLAGLGQAVNASSTLDELAGLSPLASPTETSLSQAAQTPSATVPSAEVTTPPAEPDRAPDPQVVSDVQLALAAERQTIAAERAEVERLRSNLARSNDESLEHLAAVYARMRPERAASVLGGMAPEEAAYLLPMLPQEAGALILSEMAPEKALAITEQIVRAARDGKRN